MLGTTRLHTLFGAARPGFNTFGYKSLRALLSAYAAEGLAVMSIAPGDKMPADYRTPSQRRKQEKEWLEAGNEGEPPAGFHLATSVRTALHSHLREARKIHDGPDVDPEAEYGLTPLNFGLVPDKSRLVVVDCDTTLEVNAFRNWYMDHTGDQRLRFNLDATPPSVTSPGSIKGGRWEIERDAYIYDDYGQTVYVPPVWRNIGGDAAHAGGGHWYFFYPEDYDLPAGSRSKITLHYDAESRTPLLEAIRVAEDALAYATTQEAYDAALHQHTVAVEALEQRRRWALETFENKGFLPPVGGAQPEHIASHFDVMLKNCYVIIPPSSRREGHYEVVSGDFPWETWLTDLIDRHSTSAPTTSPSGASPITHPAVVPSSASHTDTSGPGMVDGYAAVTSVPPESLNEVIEPWAQLTSWEAILRPEDGWVRQVNDRCGCPIFTAPGKHDSPKSVTAHDGGCKLPGGCSELGRLHFWTTNPPPEFAPYMSEGKTDFSKMSALAITQYGGNQRRAIESSGLTLPVLEGVGDSDDMDLNSFLMQRMDAAISRGENATSGQEALVLDPFDKVINEPPPRYIVSETFETDSFNAMIGPSGSGKSFVAIDLAASLVTGGYWMGKRCRKMKVAYFAGEGRRGVVDRFRAWQSVRNDDTMLLDNQLFFANYLPNLSMYTTQDFKDLADKIIEVGAEFVIIDTWSRANAGADENAAETTSKTIDTLNGVQRQVINALGNCTILVIHHTRKDSDSARGSSAFNAALDTELLIKSAEDPDLDQDRRLIQVEVTKQKNSEPWPEPLYCQILKVGDDVSEQDEDGFPNIVKAPASTADLNGIFPSPSGHSVTSDPMSMFGWSFTLDEPVRSVPQVDRKKIYLLVEDIVTRVGTTTESGLVTAIFDELKEPPTYFLPGTVKTDIREAIQDCVRHNLLVARGSKYGLNRTALKKSAEQVYELVTKED